ncbi:MAG: hypothetical protein A2Z99_06385 [Treponema sp. GWB1_62_6]|nr:MAG: hypothetical protein A2Y36_02935 [Treponema sp. GWA1_62_8]OHE70315.1 MAG: hypothetical protein A2Z99_06385 [Treponema sp. GWB1_62_6]HCM26852.1 hypothetical protein [Treponema sp.]
MKTIFIAIFIVLFHPKLWAEEAPNLIIRYEAYKHYTDRNTRVERVEVLIGSDFIINKIREIKESEMEKPNEIQFDSSGNQISWVDEDPLFGRTTVKITVNRNSLFIRNEWESLTKADKKVITKKKVIIHGNNGLLWEDDGMFVYLDPDGSYREVAKKPDSKYEYPPSYFTIASNEMLEWYRGHINYRVVFSSDGDRVMTKHLQENDLSEWEDLGWSSIESPGIRSDDPMVTAINAYILKEFFHLPVYLPHLLGLKAGTLRK